MPYKSNREKTEAVIEEWADDTSNLKMLAHVRDLARKLDAVKAACCESYTIELTADDLAIEILAILEIV